ncbi:hypothetical protein F5B21DRAFT_461276 [Xylaria acuta]|nr:hypothetical protein F5B21DRAFT_461276 [Xylaria acuta]
MRLCFAHYHPSTVRVSLPTLFLFSLIGYLASVSRLPSQYLRLPCFARHYSENCRLCCRPLGTSCTIRIQFTILTRRCPWPSPKY